MRRPNHEKQLTHEKKLSVPVSWEMHSAENQFCSLWLARFSNYPPSPERPKGKRGSGRGEPERGKQTFGASNEIPSAIFQSVQNGCESSRPPEDGKSPEGCARGLGLLVLLGSPSRSKRRNFPTHQNFQDKTKPYLTQIRTHQKKRTPYHFPRFPQGLKLLAAHKLSPSPPWEG